VEIINKWIKKVSDSSFFSKFVTLDLECKPGELKFIPNLPLLLSFYDNGPHH
jgi:hypothetical protein